MTVSEANNRVARAMDALIDAACRVPLPPPARQALGFAFAAQRRLGELVWTIADGKYTWEPNKVVCTQAEAIVIEIERCRDQILSVLRQPKLAEAQTNN